MTLPALHLLGPGVTTLFSAHPGCLDRLGVHYLRRWAEGSSSGGPALSCAGLSASSPTSHPGARSGSNGRRSSKEGSRWAAASRHSRLEGYRRWRRGSRGGCASWDVRWLWVRAGEILGSPIRRRKGQFGMLFSCSASYRARTSEPLFRQFQDELRRILIPRTSVNKGLLVCLRAFR